MQHRMGPEEDGHQLRNNEGHPCQRERTAKDRPNPRSDLEIELASATKRGQYLEAQVRTGQDAERTLIQKALTLILTLKVNPSEGPTHKEDKIPAKITRRRADLRARSG